MDAAILPFITTPLSGNLYLHQEHNPDPKFVHQQSAADCLDPPCVHQLMEILYRDSVRVTHVPDIPQPHAIDSHRVGKELLDILTTINLAVSCEEGCNADY